MKFVCSPYAAVDVLFRKWLIVIRRLFPDVKLPPNFHFATHIPDLILRYGPVNQFWCFLNAFFEGCTLQLLSEGLADVHLERLSAAL